MAQPATTPKIEELRFRIKTDPKSRLFFPLAEELRKVGQSGEAEQVLRTGLAHHPTYLSAWVSLGRVLRDQKNDAAAIEPLSKALQLDPGNVVAARLLADAYLATGEKLEAIKKYKLVHALMPGDEELNATIAQLERDLNPPAPSPIAVAEPEPEPESEPEAAAPEESPFAAEAIEQEVSPWGEEQRAEEATGDAEPMLAAHEESPFEEPAAAYTSAALDIESPVGMHIARAPLAAEMAVEEPAFELPPVDAPPIEPAAAAADVADVFEPAASEEPFAIGGEPEVAEPAEDFTNTITMADLYARQGLVADARMIYENILLRDPGNDAVRGKLAGLDNVVAAGFRSPLDEDSQEDDGGLKPAATTVAQAETATQAEAPANVEAPAEAEAPAEFETPAQAGSDPRIARLENWLAKVGRREGSRV